MKTKLTPVEAAKFLNLTRGRVNQLVRAGKYPGAKPCPCGHTFLIPISDLKRVERETKRGRPWPPHSV